MENVTSLSYVYDSRKHEFNTASKSSVYRHGRKTSSGISTIMRTEFGKRNTQKDWLTVSRAGRCCRRREVGNTEENSIMTINR